METFQPVLPQVSWWFWGHEHRLDVYGPFQGLERGRCLGCSAIPVVTEGSFFKPKFTNIPLLTNPNTPGAPVQLGSHDGIYNYAYAIMKLDGPSATVSYFQYDDQKSSLLFTE